jgi:hypothetical protein
MPAGFAGIQALPGQTILCSNFKYRGLDPGHVSLSPSGCSPVLMGIIYSRTFCITHTLGFAFERSARHLFNFRRDALK